jgi:hypothetical protein
MSLLTTQDIVQCGNGGRGLTVFLVTNCAAIALTSRGHVAEKNSVWRSRGMDATMR